MNCKGCGRFMTLLFPFGFVCRNKECLDCAIIKDLEGQRTNLIHYNSMDGWKKHSIKKGYYKRMRVIRMIPL